MRDVIQNVIATEAEAKTIVESARVEAGRVLADAHQKCQDIATQAHQEVRNEAEQLVESARRSADGEKKSRLNRAVPEIETGVRFKEIEQQRAVEAVFRCVSGICKPETECRT